MKIAELKNSDKRQYNKVVNHPLQSWEWGEFRKSTGVGVVRRGVFEKSKLVSGFTVTLHDIPKLPYKIGYLPKSVIPNKTMVNALRDIARANKCIFIQLEPLAEIGEKMPQNKNLVRSFHPLFTKYNFVLDITPSEEDLLASFHSKTRYNIRLAKNKHGVRVKIDSEKKSFEDFLKLLEETTVRQKFYAHDSVYHRKMFDALNNKKGEFGYHVARALYTDTAGRENTLAAWILFSFNDTLYYPYGASSSLYRFTMASNLICWEAILFGKKIGLKKFDMWGALGDDPSPNDPWYGFHKFKQGYNPRHVEYIGSYDLITNPALYNLYKVADKVRWGYLGIKKRL